MKDVAREAGVSLGTVSNVFNGFPATDLTRRKVQNAAERLGYRINNYARGLKTNKTYTVALILPSLEMPFFHHLAEAVTAELMRNGYRTILMITYYDTDVEQQCIDMVEQNKIDGIIALTYNPDLQVDASIPFVSIDRHCGASICCVSSDNYHGGELAAEALIACGCKKLLFMRIGSDVASEVDKRGAGFQAVCQTRGIPCESIILHDSETDAPFYRYLEAHVHDGIAEFDGIFCNTDRLALRILRKLAELDVRVPEDVQVIGFDGLEDYVTQEPPCSTIVQPVTFIAQTAVSVLLDRENTVHPTLICLPVRYEAHGTTKGQVSVWQANI
ncbi:MAG: LacI family DNA-binding transcriptional regulator [Oscillospiraceae bacterium]|nr:LacI family DNA-binding transcriptional regulator [Oscillospiraceae bacterium]